MNYKNLSTSLIILFSFFLISPCHSQKLNLQLTPSEKNQFAFSFDKPFYVGEDNTTSLTGIYQLYCDVPVSSNFNIIGNIPYINYSFVQDYYYNQNYHFEYNKNGVGNIFIGMQTRSDLINGKGSSISFGIFLPTANEKVSVNGVIVNYYDILKYIPNSIGLYFNYALFRTSEKGFNYNLEFGPNVLIATNGDNDETELFIHYAAGAGFRSGLFELNSEFLGIGILTDNEEDLNERLIHQISFGALLHFENITPKLFYRLYVNDKMLRRVDGVLGIGVGVELE